MARSAVELIRWELQGAYDALANRSTVSPTLSSSGSRHRDAGPCADETMALAVDYPEPPHPDPAPFTTIGWRLVHVAECKVMYHEYAFGGAKLTFPEIDSAHTPRPR